MSRLATDRRRTQGPRGKRPPRRAVPGAPGIGGSLKATCCFLHMLLRHVGPPSQVFPAGAEGQTGPNGGARRPAALRPDCSQAPERNKSCVQLRLRAVTWPRSHTAGRRRALRL